MKSMSKHQLGIAAAVTVVLLGAAVPAQAANPDWQAQKDAYRTAVTEYKAAKSDQHSKLAAIRDSFKQAVEAAKAGAPDARKSAISAAKSARDAAVAALGAAPTKPLRPEKPTGVKAHGAAVPNATIVPNTPN